ncbi:STAS domain-containing protein [Planococcus beigongshangi]|uniref:STAS domain-containing protein n=1 Tax=Planococcus beigongshangi TaxID=2782536 RepID=UPI00193BDEB8|nr:STAS domain-containing protein [Planococcus beigongshangi]
MTTVHEFSSYVSKNAHLISEEVVEYVVSHTEMEIPQEEKKMALYMYIKLLGFYSDSLEDDPDDEKFVPAHLLEWSKNNAEMQVSRGGKLSDVIVRYPLTRDIFADIMARISLEMGLSAALTATIIKRINSILDVSLTETVFAFERLSEESKSKLQKELLSLSAPVVPIRDDIVVLPLVGFIDEARVTFIMEMVIPKISTMEVEYVILDFSGVLTIDHRVAEMLVQAGKMLRMMGMSVMTTGLRPKLVQVAMHNDIKFTSPFSFSTVKQALESIEKLKNGTQ